MYRIVCFGIATAVQCILTFLAGSLTASLQEETKPKACDTEGEHLEAVYLEILS